MNRISIRSTLILSILGVLAVALLTIVENTKDYREQEWYEEKLTASELALRCMNFIKQESLGDEISLNNLNDPNETGLIGQRFTQLTTGRGSLPIKLSTANPNFAAMVVQLLKDAGVRKGDHVGMGFTSSFPGMNIMVCAAIETIGAKPVLITSVTSSSWGANAPDYTWLDMQKSLYDEGLISFMPIASSIGGNQDMGRALSNEGREMAAEAIRRNGLPMINEGSLNSNIERRMELFEKVPNMKVFINVGGGIANLGSNDNARAIPAGLSQGIKLSDFPDKQGVMFEMARNGVDILNFLNLRKLMDRYDLPVDPVPLPAVGEGGLYLDLKYDMRIVVISTVTLLILIVSVIIFDKRQNALGTEIIKTYESEK